MKIKGQEFPYKIKTWNVVDDCNEIEYVLPSEETAEQYDFTPSFATVSIINIKNPEEEVKSKVLIWDVSEIYMSTDNLYITNRLYTSYDFYCPKWSYCIMPYFRRWANTLIHKINIDWQNATYQDSWLIPWDPLTQYSMDQNWDDFRIITKKLLSREKHRSLYIR